MIYFTLLGGLCKPHVTKPNKAQKWDVSYICAPLMQSAIAPQLCKQRWQRIFTPRCQLEGFIHYPYGHECMEMCDIPPSPISQNMLAFNVSYTCQVLFFRFSCLLRLGFLYILMKCKDSNAYLRQSAAKIGFFARTNNCNCNTENPALSFRYHVETLRLMRLQSMHNPLFGKISKTYQRCFKKPFVNLFCGNLYQNLVLLRDKVWLSPYLKLNKRFTIENVFSSYSDNCTWIRSVSIQVLFVKLKSICNMT